MEKARRSSTVMDAYGIVVDWWRALSKAERDTFLRDTFPVQFSYNSGKIENDEITLHDTEEVFSNGRIVSFTGNVRTVFEITNLKNSWQQILDMAEAGAPLTVDDLLSLHLTLTTGTYDERRWVKGERPGSFKKGDYVVADNVGYAPKDVPDAIEELVEEINGFAYAPTTLAQPCLVTSCFAHALLADIHPFADGNGRVARALQSLCLLRGNCPPLIIQEKDRMAYYGALDAFHHEGDLNPFVEFSAIEAIKTWSKHASGETLASESDTESAKWVLLTARNTQAALIDEKELPEEITKRFAKRIEDVLPLENN